MKDADNHAGERGVDAGSSGRQKKTNGKRGNAAPHTLVSNEPKAVRSQEEDSKRHQVVKENKRSSRPSTGPEDWGGYNGY